MGRKVTAQQRAELEKAIRAREEAENPEFDISIVVADEFGPDGKIPVSVTRTPKTVKDLSWSFKKD